MLSELNDPAAVRSAMAEFDRIGREPFLRKYGFGPSRDYFVEHDGRLYDSKAIAGAAFGYEFPARGPLRFNQFKGGESSVKKRLEGLGFRVTDAAPAPEHYLLKLNRDQVPGTYSSRDWEAREFNVEPVRSQRAGQLLDPRPPAMAPGSEVAVWINDDGDLGGILATAVIADISGSGCSLKNVTFCERIGLAELSGSHDSDIRGLYEDVDANRRSKVRHLSRAQWDALELLIESDQTNFVARMASLLDEQARDFRINSLQEIRSRIHQKRRAGSTIFSARSIMATYAFHLGGREELQFNIGEEEDENGPRFRWGVAFSFEPSRSFPDPSVLARKVRFFNDYIALYGDSLSDMRMWYFADGSGPTEIGPPQPIDASLVRNHVFVFLGKHAPHNEIDAPEILTDFDHLLPLYEYVESAAAVAPARPVPMPFIFRPGHKKKARHTTASIAARELDIELRHEAIQEALHDLLRSQYGAEFTGTEQVCVSGKRIDAVVKREAGYWLYEIKTSSAPRMCIREAVGQLLEYCLWPGGVLAEKLIVVGETALDADAATYLESLNARLSIPIEYLAVKSRAVGESPHS